VLRYYRAVALDLDGTITSGGPPDATVLKAIRAARGSGMRILLVTGRILAELDAEMPGLVDEFDAVVAENGGVLAVEGVLTRLAEPVEPGLAQRLREQGVLVRSGQVLLACDGSVAHQAIDAVHDMQVDVQIIWNRGSLMLLPGGVTKGTGVQAGLAALGISPHSAIGVGDAENDHALLHTCELGIAVANAVPALAEHADLVLAEHNGQGISAFLAGPIVRGTEVFCPRRWNLLLGTNVDDGHMVTIPASQSNILITGNSGSGKSYVTGLLAEQMINLGYSVLLIDPEGDYAELGMLRNTLLVGDTGRLPSPQELMRIIEHERSVVLDLSVAHHDVTAYMVDVHHQLRARREQTGLPHWFVIDEAHRSLSLSAAVHDWGYCLATYQPDGLNPQTVNTMGWQLRLLHEQRGEAVLTPVHDGGPATTVRIAARATSHVRHHHKYTDADLPSGRGFHFRTDHGRTGVVATNLRQFLTAIQQCDPAVIRHHAGNGDFSRWVRDVLRDPGLAGQLRQIEYQVAGGGIESIRTDLLDSVSSRYAVDVESPNCCAPPMGSPDTQAVQHLGRNRR
jgi:hydroxymethylpyrimidine pyrophosphatase-like HAD family hydrolase